MTSRKLNVYWKIEYVYVVWHIGSCYSCFNRSVRLSIDLRVFLCSSISKYPTDSLSVEVMMS